MNETELKNNIFDEVLKFSVRQKMEEDAYTIDPAIDFTPEFERDMQKMFAKNKRREKALRRRGRALRIAAAVLVFLVVSSLIVMNVDAVRLPVINFFSETEKESTTLNFKTLDPRYADFKDVMHKVYILNYIPKGYTVKDIFGDGSTQSVIYRDEDRNNITLEYVTSGSIGIDTENTTKAKITFNGSNADYYHKVNPISKQDERFLVFNYDNQVLVISTILSEDEMLRMANSVAYVK